MHRFIHEEIKKLSNLLIQIQKDSTLLNTVNRAAQFCIDTIKNGKKILFAGNGGSAADAQHLAAELVGRLRFNRPGLPAIALTTDTSALTAIGNDYGFDLIFSRQVEALGQPGDVLIGISTSGKSSNVLNALKVAREKNITTIGMTGKQAPLMDEQCDLIIHVPSNETSKIQECHILLGHIVCAIIEDQLFGAQHDMARISTEVA